MKCPVDGKSLHVGSTREQPNGSVMRWRRCSCGFSAWTREVFVKRLSYIGRVARVLKRTVK